MKKREKNYELRQMYQVHEIKIETVNLEDMREQSFW